jgi:predicted dehydrogenase
MYPRLYGVQAPAGMRILLEINDPALHLDYFRRVAGLGKPIYIDKPLAGSLAEAQAMVALAEHHGCRMTSCSSTRMSVEFTAALMSVPDPTLVYAYGTLGTPPVGDAVYWYGVHTFEMVQRALGHDFATVTAHQTAAGIVSLIEYPEGRQAIVELSPATCGFGGRLQGEGQSTAFAAESGNLYFTCVQAIRDFFHGGANPASLGDALGVTALMDATRRSLDAGRAVGPCALG